MSNSAFRIPQSKELPPHDHPVFLFIAEFFHDLETYALMRTQGARVATGNLRGDHFKPVFIEIAQAVIKPVEHTHAATFLGHTNLSHDKIVDLAHGFSTPGQVVEPFKQREQNRDI